MQKWIDLTVKVEKEVVLKESPRWYDFRRGLQLRKARLPWWTADLLPSRFLVDIGGPHFLASQRTSTMFTYTNILLLVYEHLVIAVAVQIMSRGHADYHLSRPPP